jgi:putative redox protein
MEFHADSCDCASFPFSQGACKHKRLLLQKRIMAKIEVRLVQRQYGFEATDEAGKTMTMDNSVAGGGGGYGVSPMQSMLMALGGCSGIDIVSILNKQRQPFTSVVLSIEGEREKDKVPALWEKMHVSFQIGGPVERSKAEYAAQLSIEKYCSVAETLRRAGCLITWDVRMEEIMPETT